MKRKRYSVTYKEEAVRLVLDQGLSVLQASQDLGMKQSTLETWVRKEKKRRKDPSLPTEREHVEMIRLRRENEILRQERDILKKAATFFAKEGS